MRSRLVILLSAASVVMVAMPMATVARSQDGSRVSAAQDPTGNEEEAEGQEGQGGPGEGQGTAEAETGAGGQTEGGSSEAGPPWTYQMARLSVALLLALGGGIGLMYYRFVAKRRRGEI
jgi:hypothetical protein